MGKIIGIGASAGGLKPMMRLLEQLPVDLPATLMVVLHRPQDSPSYLKEILERVSLIPVRLATEGAELKAPVCFVSPVAYQMTVTPARRIHLVPDGFYRGNNVDLLFRSLADSVGKDAVGIVLSGMLADGTRGLTAIKAAGGMALVQNPEEAEHSGMPKSAIGADGKVDRIGTVKQLAVDIVRVCHGLALHAALPGPA